MEKLRSEEPPKVTYRKTRKHGVYKVVTGPWQRAQDQGIILSMYQCEAVDPRKLSDREAQLAGIDSAEELLRLFRRWYGRLPEKMWRNWFLILKNGEEETAHEN